LIAFLVLDAGAKLCDFVGFEEVVDADISVAVSAGNKGVLMSKFGRHHLACLLDGALDTQLLLELHFLDDSRVIGKVLGLLVVLLHEYTMIVGESSYNSKIIENINQP
jgi:hypothetical protein